MVIKLFELLAKNLNGRGMFEYILIIVLISLAAVAAIPTVGTGITVE